MRGQQGEGGGKRARSSRPLQRSLLEAGARERAVVPWRRLLQQRLLQQRRARAVVGWLAAIGGKAMCRSGAVRRAETIATLCGRCPRQFVQSGLVRSSPRAREHAVVSWHFCGSVRGRGGDLPRIEGKESFEGAEIVRLGNGDSQKAVMRLEAVLPEGSRRWRC